MSAEIVIDDKRMSDALQKFVGEVTRQEQRGCCVTAVGILVFHEPHVEHDTDDVIIQTWANMNRAELVDFLRTVAADLRLEAQEPEEA